MKGRNGNGIMIWTEFEKSPSEMAAIAAYGKVAAAPICGRAGGRAGGRGGGRAQRSKAGVQGSSPGRRTGCSRPITQHVMGTDKHTTRRHKHTTERQSLSPASTPSTLRERDTTDRQRETTKKPWRGGGRAGGRSKAGVQGSSPGRRTGSDHPITQHVMGT
eukprot:SAG31_NODE_13963_length_834_cov_1.570068_1_plen_160_part_10